MLTTLFRDKEFNRKLLALVFPIAFQQFMLALVNASDAVMLGSLSQNSMAAVSLATQVAFVESLFLAAMTIGLSMLAAQYWGKEDYAAVERIFAYVFKITLLICFLFFLAALFFPTYLMRIFTNESALIEDGAIYLRTVSLSFLLNGISQTFLCILKNSEKAAIASIISSTSVVVNIVLNALFIFGLPGLPGLGVAGAAIATVLARVLEVIWCILLVKRNNKVSLRTRYMLHKDTVLTHDFWKYTAPVLGNEIVWGVGFTMYSVIMGHLGTDAVAANSLATIIKNLVACFCIGLANGGGIMIGNVLGTGNLENAKTYGQKLCLLSCICGALSGLLLLAVSPLVLHFANLTPTAHKYLGGMLLMCSLYMIGKSVNSTTIAGIFCAGGDSRFGFLCDTVTMWGIIVPLGFLTAFVWKLPVLAVYFILNMDEFVKLPAVYRHYKKYLWVKDITQ